ncbi:single-stranded DNA-binding protein [Grimontia hollisae]|uniref:single-stranded DNA-binding protein n=1 Tax=Grimontia hollisae TaxID=673 RepID=UPI0023DA4F7D|nr:single-stranded DNA-binding protein [Grimontia hollisae]MDF2185444.1 single-stranded DNA-binding protein [Grimontia hollisae]
MLKIEVFPEDEQISIRTIPARDDKPERHIREQIAYAYLGGKFPVQMKLQIEEGQPHYAAGTYTVHSSSFTVNQFGGLELKRFGMIIEPVSA